MLGGGGVAAVANGRERDYARVRRWKHTRFAFTHTQRRLGLSEAAPRARAPLPGSKKERERERRALFLARALSLGEKREKQQAATFGAGTLGMTLSKAADGSAAVTSVTPGGSAAAAGVAVGDAVVARARGASRRARFHGEKRPFQKAPTCNSTNKTGERPLAAFEKNRGDLLGCRLNGQRADYDEFMSRFPSLSRPVTLGMSRVGVVAAPASARPATAGERDVKMTRVMNKT